MATAIPDLWSEDIKVDVLTPIAILKAQEGLLASKTQGILQAKLATTETEKLVQHQLDLIAPSLNFYRERLLSAIHDPELLYPVTVIAEAFAPPPTREPMSAIQAMFSGGVRRTPERRAASDDDFIRLVREVLRSETVRALIHSLIAKSNASAEPPTNGPEIPTENAAG